MFTITKNVGPLTFWLGPWIWNFRGPAGYWEKNVSLYPWLEPNGGGEENGPAQSFPTPLLRRNMQLAKCFLNLNFSLGQDNHECSDTVQEYVKP